MAAEQSESGSGQPPQQPEGQNGNSKSFSKKCSRAVKKQRAKLYIVRRCIAILLCWHEKS